MPAILASGNTCNWQYAQRASGATGNSWKGRHRQLATLATSNTCNWQHVQLATRATGNTCTDNTCNWQLYIMTTS